MANLQETSQWETGIYRIELQDPVVGGEDGIDNIQAKQLGNRTLWLKEQLSSLPEIDGGVGPNTLVKRDENGRIQVPAPVTENDAANKGYVLGRTRDTLTAHKTIYLSATGNDANDGSAAGKAKATWAGVQAILDKIDPAGYVVTVQVSGLISGDATIDCTGYSYGKLILKGTSPAQDGFTGSITVTGGGVTTTGLSYGSLTSGVGAHIYFSGTNRLTGLATPENGLVANGGSTSSTSSAIIEYTGEFLAVLYARSVLKISGSSSHSPIFRQVVTPVFSYFAEAAMEGTITLYQCQYEGDVQPTESTLYFYAGGIITGSSPAEMPGGGTITYLGTSYLNAKGVARAAGQISSSGILTKSFGITSVTKTTTGVYEIVHNLSNPLPVVSQLSSVISHITADTANNTTTVKVFNASGAAADFGFSIAIF
jgi:hypothetical protein